MQRFFQRKLSQGCKRLNLEFFQGCRNSRSYNCAFRQLQPFPRDLFSKIELNDQKVSWKLAVLKQQVMQYSHAQNLSCVSISMCNFSRRSFSTFPRPDEKVAEKGFDDLELKEAENFVDFEPLNEASFLEDLADPALLENAPFVESTALGAAAIENAASGLDSIGYYPSEIVMRAIEMIHVTADIPYWSAILVFTVLIRFGLLPLQIMSMRSAAKMAATMPEAKAIQRKYHSMGELTQEQIKQMQTEMMGLWKKHGVKPLHSILGTMCQFPVFISVFVGLQEMGKHFPGLSTGGIYSIYDLTVADPTFVMPFITSLSLIAMAEFGVDMPPNQNNQKMKNFMRFMGVIAFPLSYHFPAGLFVYWFSSSIYSLGQSIILKNPKVKDALGIPPPPPPSEVDENLSPTFLFKKQMEEIARKSKLQHELLKQAAELKTQKDKNKNSDI